MSLETWVMIGNWDFLDQSPVDEFLDKVEAAGVRSLAFGGSPPLDPNPHHYRDSPVKGRTPPERTMAYRTRVQALLRSAVDRRMQVFFYGTNPHAAGHDEVYRQIYSKRYIDVDHTRHAVNSYWGACMNSPQFLPYYLGRIRDVHEHFPEVAGFLNDGPEFGYEIEPGFMDDNWSLFSCLGTCCEGRATARGYDFEGFAQVAGDLRGRLSSLTENAIERMEAHAGGPIGALAVALQEPLIDEWFRFKRESAVDYVAELTAGIKEVNRAYLLGVGSRLPAFTPLTGYDLTRVGRTADFVLPKVYLWMGGVDGLYGTVYRWVKWLQEWNPRLGEDQLFRFVNRLFGLALPEVNSLADMGRYIGEEQRDGIAWTRDGQPFPQRFFSEVVAGQVEEMIAQAGDAARVRPWLDTDHGGRELTPRELDLTLQAAEGAGLRTYLYYCPMEEPFWDVAVRHARGD